MIQHSGTRFMAFLSHNCRLRRIINDAILSKLTHFPSFHPLYLRITPAVLKTTYGKGMAI